jgi:hypothetical protein
MRMHVHGRQAGRVALATFVLLLALVAAIVQPTAQARELACKSTSAAHAKRATHCQKTTHPLKGKKKPKSHHAKVKRVHPKKKSTTRSHINETGEGAQACDEGPEAASEEAPSSCEENPCEEGSEAGESGEAAPSCEAEEAEE